MGFFKPNIEKMKTEEDVEGLIKALNDKSQEMQERATEALIFLMRNPEVVRKGRIIRILGERQCKAVSDDFNDFIAKGREEFTDWAQAFNVNDPVQFRNISRKFADYFEATIAIANKGEKNVRDDLNNILKITAVVLGIGARNDTEIPDFLKKDAYFKSNLNRCEDFRVRAERAYDKLSLHSY